MGEPGVTKCWKERRSAKRRIAPYLATTVFVFVQICLSWDTGMRLIEWSRRFVVYSLSLIHI